MPTDIKAGKRVMSQKGSAARLPIKRAEKYHERLDSMFVDIEQLQRAPAGPAPEVRLELEALRARLFALEKQISEDKESAPSPDGTPSKPAVANTHTLPSAPLLYEREQAGFAFSDGRLEPIRETGLENIPSAITVPLTDSGEPIGKVQIAPPPERPLTPEETDVVNAVAQQASLQIQSLRLLAETERARAEAESATRQFMHTGWASYLDAIHQNERIGYAYDQAGVEPFIGKIDPGVGPENRIEETVSVLEEQVGAVYLTPDPTRRVTEDDRQMISSVANQIAQQVESIRLQADAVRARSEADEVIRRVTRESWATFTAEKEAEALGFAYDTNQVTPFGSALPKDVAISLPCRCAEKPSAGWRQPAR